MTKSRQNNVIKESVPGNFALFFHCLFTDIISTINQIKNIRQTLQHSMIRVESFKLTEDSAKNILLQRPISSIRYKGSLPGRHSYGFVWREEHVTQPYGCLRGRLVQWRRYRWSPSLIASGRSFKQKDKSLGPSREPSGIPQLPGFDSDLSPLTTGNCFVSQG